MNRDEHSLIWEEQPAPAKNGMAFLLLLGFLYLAAIFSTIYFAQNGLIFPVVVSITYLCLGWIPFCGLKVLRPNEAYVLTLFGKYYGTLIGPGFFFVNPFTTAINPAGGSNVPSPTEISSGDSSAHTKRTTPTKVTKYISLKSMTLNNDKQKINDKLGNPIIIGIVVIWRVTNTARAAFNVDNYAEYLSIQCDSALRNIVRLYPYDISDEDDLNEKSLRGSSTEISQHLRDEIQSKVELAGLEIMEARITHLAYAPEIAVAMLQRQQAKAIIDARQMIVEGAVGMVETALAKLSENEIVTLDEDRKAAMVSNLLVVLCGNKDAQPVVNSGSLY